MARKWPQMEDFDDVWELYSQVDQNSDLEYPSRAIFKFRRLQSIPKSRFFFVFMFSLDCTQDYPNGHLGHDFSCFLVIFNDFRVPLGTPLRVTFNILFPSCFRSEFQGLLKPNRCPGRLREGPPKALRRLRRARPGRW